MIAFKCKVQTILKKHNNNKQTNKPPKNKQTNKQNNTRLHETNINSAYIVPNTVNFTFRCNLINGLIYFTGIFYLEFQNDMYFTLERCLL